MRVRIISLALLLLIPTLAACEGIPAAPTARPVGNITVRDNPPYMNGGTLDILNYWYAYTHQVLPLTKSTDAVTVETENSMMSTTSTVAMPANVIMARAAWLDNGDAAMCGLGILVTGGGVLFTVANPPAGLAGTIVAWSINLGGVVGTLDACWSTFMSTEVDDAIPRWFLGCRDAYLSDQNWNMLKDFSDERVSTVKFQQCIVYGWAASVAARSQAWIDPNGIATLNGIYICTQEIVPRCYWA